MKTEKLKSEGKYFEAGQNARENNEPRAYGCHFGMRSSRDYAMTEFYKGYDTNPEKEQEPAKEEEPVLHPDFDLPEEPRMVCVFIANFGDKSDKEAICATISRLTPYRAYVNENGVPVIPCRAYEIGDLFAYLSRFPQTNWVEYSVQFNF